ncbi:MAG TPA: glutathione S-transferase family protein [Solirubrobacterales bacterium]|nr:glutathione S-transferase family protein [Solirubrobacterales bacterium]
MPRPPRLWQYNFSNYNEKARWALDYKRIAHVRRTVAPVEPRAMAFSLRGTLPVLDLGGERIADSSGIIDALERLHPEPALYPRDPAERERALALQRDFDDEVGHAMRRALFWELRDDRDYMAEFITVGRPALQRALMKLTFPLGWLYVSRRYTFAEPEAERAWGTLEDALDRIERERGSGEFLVGDSFSVADLTAASLLWPLAWPDELQYELPRPPGIPRLERLQEHPAAAWIGEIWARHRPPSCELPR